MAIGQQVDDFWNWLRPRMAVTFGRFPIAIILQLVATVMALGVGNGWFWDGDSAGYHWSAAVSAAAIFALAGSLFSESRPLLRLPGLLLSFALPALVVVAFAFDRHEVDAPSMLLLPVGLLWLSVSASTQGWGGARAMVQDRFWWLNHQSVVGAIVCLLGYGVVVVGLLLIEGTLRSLFNFSPDRLFGSIATVLGLFVGPLLWLSTIPRSTDFLASFATVPDNVARATGALAQFVATPLLFIYVGILLAYLVQILVTWTLPQNTISWMVLTCSFVGAVNWLLLHPSFQHGKLLVRLYRASWFWLLLPPLALYGLSVFLRIDDYGLTPERILLVVGFIWAVLVALTHIVGLGDVRLIPALGAVVLALVAAGPLSLDNLTRLDQGARLHALLEQAGVDGMTIARPWSVDEALQVESILQLLSENPADRQVLTDVLARHGVVMDNDDYPSVIIDSIQASKDLSAQANAEPEEPFLLSSVAEPQVDLSATPVFLAFIDLYPANNFEGRELRLSIRDNALVVSSPDHISPPTSVDVDMTAWLSNRGQLSLRDSSVDFAFAGRNYRLVLQQIYVQPEMVDGASVRRIGQIRGALFGAVPEPEVN